MNDFDEQMVEEGKNADEDATAKKVREEFNRLRKLDWTYREILDHITEEFRIESPERYIEQ